MQNATSPWCGLFKELIEVSSFDDSDSPLVRSKEFSVLYINKKDNLQKKKGGERQCRLITLASLDKLTMEENELSDRINEMYISK